MEPLGSAGEVVGDAEWMCELGRVAPGASFRLPCGGPAANGSLSFVGVKRGDLARGGELSGLGFVAGLPGRYRFSEVDGQVVAERVAETCEGG